MLFLRWAPQIKKISKNFKVKDELIHLGKFKLKQNYDSKY